MRNEDDNKTNNTDRPQRRSIGTVGEDFSLEFKPIKKRSEVSVESTQPRQIRRTEPEQPVQPIRRQTVQPVQPVQRQAVQPVQPVQRQTVQPVQPVRRQTAQPVQPAQRQTAQPVQPQRNQAAQPEQRFIQRPAGLGIMPPMYLKNPSQYMRPYKIDGSAEQPALRQRHEMKYYLNYADYIVLRNKLKALMRFDENAVADGGYFIRSLYLDDMYNTAVIEKQAGIQYRSKYRIRIYNYQKNVIKFEKKIKTGEFISKDSFSMTYREFCMLRDGDIEFLLHRREPLAKEVYLKMRQNLLRPCVVVDYDREPFVMNYETIRITFDRDIRTGKPSWDIFDPNLPVMPLLEKGTVVLEVKFAKALPEYIAEVINSVGSLQRSSVSKYIICRQYD